jgi:maleate cis-trans isomerase
LTILGHRARIGYCSPPFVTETFCYEFYKMVPEGVTLMITTLEVRTRARDELDSSHARALTAAKYMADAGADVVVLGGNPVNQTLGVGNLAGICADLSAEIGAPVVTSTQAQTEALTRLGARKVAQVQCYEPADNERHAQSIRNMGFEAAGVVACDYTDYTVGTIPDDMALTLARRVKQENPEADAIHLCSAHWGMAHAIDEIESELNVSVMTSQQAILWKALRTAGIDDSIAGYGRLLREF